MKLDLNIGDGRFGVQTEPLVVGSARSLTADDLALLESSNAGAKPEPLKAIRARHHSAARLLAAGHRPVEVAAFTGYSASRISILQADPSFQELIEFYRNEVVDLYVDLHERLAGLSADAIAILADRLETDPDKFTNNELNELTKTGADRVGHGPSTKSTNVNIHFGLGDKLAAAAKRVKTIEGTVNKDDD